MSFRMLETMGKDDDTLCFIGAEPDGVGRYGYKLSLGKRIGTEAIDSVSFTLEDRYPGLTLGSLISNSISALLFHRDVVAVITECNDLELELIPFDLFNHKGRLHSADYSIVNPIGTYDCLDYEASELELDEDGDSIGLMQHVLSKKKLGGAPELLRIHHSSSKYLFSQSLIDKLESSGFTNLVWAVLDVVD